VEAGDGAGIVENRKRKNDKVLFMNELMIDYIKAIRIFIMAWIANSLGT
jgi:hypothetical protein